MSFKALLLTSSAETMAAIPLYRDIQRFPCLRVHFRSRQPCCGGSSRENQPRRASETQSRRHSRHERISPGRPKRHIFEVRNAFLTGSTWKVPVFPHMDGGMCRCREGGTDFLRTVVYVGCDGAQDAVCASRAHWEGSGIARDGGRMTEGVAGIVRGRVWATGLVSGEAIRSFSLP